MRYEYVLHPLPLECFYYGVQVLLRIGLVYSAVQEDSDFPHSQQVAMPHVSCGGVQGKRLKGNVWLLLLLI